MWDFLLLYTFISLGELKNAAFGMMLVFLIPVVSSLTSQIRETVLIKLSMWVYYGPISGLFTSVSKVKILVVKGKKTRNYNFL